MLFGNTTLKVIGMYRAATNSWVSVEQKAENLVRQTFTASARSTTGGNAPMPDYAILPEELLVSGQVATTNDSSNKWGVDVKGSSGTTYTSSPASSSGWGVATTGRSAVSAFTGNIPTTEKELLFALTKTGSPGDAQLSAKLLYRLIYYQGLPVTPDLWIDAAGGSFSGYTNNQNVSGFTESSSNAYAITNGSFSSSVKFYTNIQNGLPALYINSLSSGFLDYGNILNVTNGISFFLVGQQGGTNAGTIFSRGDGSTTGTQYSVSRASGAGNLTVNVGVSGNQTTNYSTTYGSGFDILSGIIDPANNIKLYLNGTQITGSPSSLFPTGSFTQYSSQHFLLGASNYASATNFANFYVGEFIAVGGAITSQKHSDTVAFLRNKWATP